MSMDPQQVIEHISREIDRRWQMERDAIEDDKRRTRINAEQMMAHIDREIERLWSLEVANRRADGRHRTLVALWRGVIAALPVVTVLVTAGFWLHGSIQSAAVNAAKDTVNNEVAEIKADYADLRQASVDLIKGVSEEAANVSQQLGAAKRDLAAANKGELDKLAEALDAELQQSRRQIVARINQTQADLSKVEQRVQNLDDALNIAQAEADVQQLTELLDTIRGNEGLEEWSKLRLAVDQHEDMLSGRVKVPLFRIGDLQLVDNQGNIHGRLYRNSGRWEFFIQADDHTTLSMSVTNGGLKPKIESRTRPGQYDPWTPGL